MRVKKASKAIAAALAMAMCVPGSVFASGATPTATPAPAATSGSFTTSFDVYSPKLTVKVPVNLDVKVNPLADSASTGVKYFSVASNSIDVWNASVDTEADAGIPINVTVKATITEKKDDVLTEYNTFTSDVTATTKRVNLMLSEADTDAVIALKTGETAAYEAADNKVLKLSQWETGTEAVYRTGSATAPVKSVAITKYGSLLSVDIAKPTLAAGATSYIGDATKVTPTVGSFAVTGVANASADWKADDIKVEVTYDIKASAARGIATPAIATPPTFASGGTADLTIIIPNVGEAKVFAVGCHNDGEGLYGDYIWESSAYKVTYAENSTTSGQIDATITIPKTDAGLSQFLAGNDYKGKKQDFVVGLSDGRMVVSTLTVN